MVPPRLIPGTGSQLAAIHCHQGICVVQGMLWVSFGLTAAHPLSCRGSQWLGQGGLVIQRLVVVGYPT